MELENQKTSSRELFLPENDFQNSSIVNFPKQHPEFEGLEINQRHEIQTWIFLHMQWCNITLAQWFCVTKICLQLSKITKICLFDHLTGWATSWKANFEDYYRCYLIKWYQFLSIKCSMSNTSFRFGTHFYCLLVPKSRHVTHESQVSSSS